MSSADVRDVWVYKVQEGPIHRQGAAEPPAPRFWVHGRLPEQLGARRGVWRAAVCVLLRLHHEGAGATVTEHVSGAGSAPGRPLSCRRRMTSVRHCVCQGPCEAADVSVVNCAHGSCASVWLRTALDRPHPPLCPRTPLLRPAVRPRQLSLHLERPLPAVIFIRLCAGVLAALSAGRSRPGCTHLTVHRSAVLSGSLHRWRPLQGLPWANFDGPAMTQSGPIGQLSACHPLSLSSPRRKLCDIPRKHSEHPGDSEFT